MSGFFTGLLHLKRGPREALAFSLISLGVVMLMQPWVPALFTWSFLVTLTGIRLDPAAPYRGEVLAAEYLGTSQIVTLKTTHGDVKARLQSDRKVSVGETTGLTFDPRTITIFGSERGRALRSAGNEGVLTNA